jgi:hypothetical protein
VTPPLPIVCGEGRTIQVAPKSMKKSHRLGKKALKMEQKGADLNGLPAAGSSRGAMW